MESWITYLDASRSTQCKAEFLRIRFVKFGSRSVDLVGRIIF
jgi:hypothetical protein